MNAARRAVLSWSMYDWANSAFSLTVVTAFVPVLLSAAWNDAAASPIVTFRLGMANALASLLVAMTAPLLGAVADGAGQRKALLLLLTAVGAVMTAGLYFVSAGQWLFGLALYVLASIGFAGSNSLYDAMLPGVAPHDLDRVSALGYGLGYLGGALLFAVNVMMVAQPGWFALDSPEQAMRISFVMVACWWAFFSLPLLLYVPDIKPAVTLGMRAAVAAAWRRVRATMIDVRAQPSLLWFLLAYWLYIDAVYTIIKMAVDFGMSRGLDPNDLIKALLLTNFIGFPAALAFGAIGARIGARRGIFITLSVYLVATMLAPLISTAWHFYILAAVIGLVQGGVQSLSRSFFARLIPAERAAEYFGFYNMLGKFAAIFGPALTGVVTLLTGSQQLGVLSIALLFGAGILLLSRVQEPRAG